MIKTVNDLLAVIFCLNIVIFFCLTEEKCSETPKLTEEKCSETPKLTEEKCSEHPKFTEEKCAKHRKKLGLYFRMYNSGGTF